EFADILGMVLRHQTMEGNFGTHYANILGLYQFVPPSATMTKRISFLLPVRRAERLTTLAAGAPARRLTLAFAGSFLGGVSVASNGVVSRHETFFLDEASF